MAEFLRLRNTLQLFVFLITVGIGIWFYVYVHQVFHRALEKRCSGTWIPDETATDWFSNIHASNN